MAVRGEGKTVTTLLSWYNVLTANPILTAEVIYYRMGCVRLNLVWFSF